MKKKSFIFVLVLILILILVGTVTVFLGKKEKHEIAKIIVPDSPLPTPSSKKDAVLGMQTTKIPKKDYYTIFMVGDSMTEQLGDFGGQINESLNRSYKSTRGHQRIVIDNYATGSTNILGLQDAMQQKKVHKDGVLPPLLSRKFDILLLESFGYNPLSQLGLDGGLRKQTETLNSLTQQFKESHPEALVIFVATIAPHKETYGQELSPGNTQEQRVAAAEERMKYLENHIKFAKEHNIPLIDIYHKTLKDGDGDLTYINPLDHVHPSYKGVEFISREIANYIYVNEILPR